MSICNEEARHRRRIDCAASLSKRLGHQLCPTLPRTRSSTRTWRELLARAGRVPCSHGRLSTSTCSKRSAASRSSGVLYRPARLRHSVQPMRTDDEFAGWRRREPSNGGDGNKKPFSQKFPPLLPIKIKFCLTADTENCAGLSSLPADTHQVGRVFYEQANWRKGELARSMRESRKPEVELLIFLFRLPVLPSGLPRAANVA